MSTDSSASIAEFSRCLKQAKLELDATDIADILWLAVQINKIAPTSTPTPESTEETPQIESSSPIGNTFSTTPVSNFSDSKPPVSAYTSPPQKSLENADSFPAQPFRMPTAEALANKLELDRSLRPLKRKVLSRIDKVLDEEATAIKIAQAVRNTQENLWNPVLQPAPERWLELAIVIEKTDSFPIWQQTIREFQQLMERHGTFRNVRVWHLQADGTGKLQLFAGERTIREQRPRSFKELLDPLGRRLILVVSDCVSSAWRSHPLKKTQSGQPCHIKSVLDLWAKSNPVTLLHLLPQHLWNRSALGAGIFVSLKSQAPGVANSHLKMGEIPGWIEIDRKTQLILPIVTLEPKPLKQWAKVIAGNGQTRTAGVILDDSLLEIQAEIAAETTQTLTPEMRIKHFWATASLTARQLAGLMAAAPVSLPVVYMIQRQMLPESSPVHLAEVFMSGLLCRVESSNNKIYDFVEGVRQRLIDATPISETETVLEKLTEFVAEKTGVALHDFTAFLAADFTWDDSVRQEIIPFARVTREVLLRLGGDYARLVDSAQQEQVISAQLSQSWLTEFPPLQKFKFKVANITLIDDSINLQNFNFEVAFIEVNQSTTLSNDILLEMVDEAVYNQKGKPLTNIEWQILKGALENLTYNQIYSQIIESANYPEHEEDIKYLIDKKVFRGEPWKILTEIVGEKVNKSNVKSIINQWANGPKLTIRRYPQQATGFIENLDKDIQLEMMLIPGGTFVMGSSPDELKHQDDESPQHTVKVQPFFFGKYTVTQVQWQFVAELPQVNRELNANPSLFKGADRPVERISWLDAVEFCDRLSNYTKRRYRLPSEAEWEYACRAGTITPFHFGETISTDLANYYGDYVYGSGSKGIYRRETTPVGSFGVANTFGLYDMHGNIWEWCADRWHDNYEGAPNDGSAWFEHNEDKNDSQICRVLRGGSWYFYANFCRSAYRVWDVAGSGNYGIGFRVVCAAV
ncbi:MAG TPA: formylglycine-generating enzyme family protein [Leptolyngbyaceae cyanobacterium]